MQILKKSVADACKEKDDIAQQLRAVIDEKEELRKRSEELSVKLMEIERQIEKGIFFKCILVWRSRCDLIKYETLIVLSNQVFALANGRKPHFDVKTFII